MKYVIKLKHIVIPKNPFMGICIAICIYLQTFVGLYIFYVSESMYLILSFSVSYNFF